MARLEGRASTGARHASSSAPARWDDGLRPLRRPRASSATARCRRKFLRFFPDGFRDESYLEWERAYKWQAHEND